jgi:hypothetical protein
MNGNDAVASTRIAISVVNQSISSLDGSFIMKQCGGADQDDRGSDGKEGVHMIIGYVAWAQYSSDGARVVWEDE